MYAMIIRKIKHEANPGRLLVYTTYTSPMRLLPGLAGGFAAFLLAPVCLAQVTKDDIAADLRSYYGGERTSAYVVAGLGAASVGAGSYLVTRKSDFARGLGWPLLTMGALEGIGAVFYAFQVGSEIDHYESLLDRDPAAYKREELEHLDGTTSRFVAYRATELGLTLAGVGLASYGFIADKDVFKGIGIGVAAVGVPFLVIDTINNARAQRYRDRVSQFSPGVSVKLQREKDWFFSCGGSF